MLEELKVPNKLVDVVLDTDAYNEIDDQFAIAYMFCSQDRLNIKAIYAAPFVNDRSSSAKEGMEKSYDEILKLNELLGNKDSFKNIYKGSDEFIKDGKPVVSDAAKDLAKRAMNYSKENPLYVIAIAALTNIASAILINPEITERIILVWLGGNAINWPRQNEFNMRGDIEASNICLKSMSNRLVQLPCAGVVSTFITTEPELKYWIYDKNEVCNYLVDAVIKFHEGVRGTPWSKVIWDVTAVAYMLNDDNKFMSTRIESIPTYTTEFKSNYEEDRGKEIYVSYIFRDRLFNDLFKKLSDANLFKYLDRDN